MSPTRRDFIQTIGFSVTALALPVQSVEQWRMNATLPQLGPATWDGWYEMPNVAALHGVWYRLSSTGLIFQVPCYCPGLPPTEQAKRAMKESAYDTIMDETVIREQWQAYLDERRA